MPAMKKYLAWFIPSFVLGATGCPDVKVDPGEGVNDTPPSGPVAEFDPANKVIPFPNNLVLDPATGKVNLPKQCNEGALAKATRENVLNKLDGFGTYETAMQITFNEPVDEASLAGHVVLYKRAAGATAVDPATATEVPLKLIKGSTIRYADQSQLETTGECTGPQTVDALTMIPLIPLDQKSTYVAALLKGVKTASGEEYGATFTWSLIRQDQDPVTLDEQGNVTSDTTPLSPAIPAQLEQLKGIDLLWKAHAKALAFLSAKHAREDILLAWEFTTQTVTDPLDPSVPGSLAAMGRSQKLGLVHSVLGGATPEQFFQAKLPPGSCTVDGGAIPCNAVGDIIGGLLNVTSYQQVLPAKVTTTSPDPNMGGPLAGPGTIRSSRPRPVRAACRCSAWCRVPALHRARLPPSHRTAGRSSSTATVSAALRPRSPASVRSSPPLASPRSRSTSLRTTAAPSASRRMQRSAATTGSPRDRSRRRARSRPSTIRTACAVRSRPSIRSATRRSCRLISRRRATTSGRASSTCRSS
jgi:hypothetical protein